MACIIISDLDYYFALLVLEANGNGVTVKVELVLAIFSSGNIQQGWRELKGI